MEESGMSDDGSFVVVPFQRVGTSVRARQMLIVKSATDARALLQKLSRQFPGVALIERRTDRETGDEIDTLVQTFGAVPAGVPTTSNWTMALQ